MDEDADIYVPVDDKSDQTDSTPPLYVPKDKSDGD